MNTLPDTTTEDGVPLSTAESQKGFFRRRVSVDNSNGKLTGESDDGSVMSSSGQSGSDEIQAMRDLSKKETNQIRSWRGAVTLMLLITAVAVSFTTYWFLRKEEDNNFEQAYNEYSTTIANAAIAQQRNIRAAFEGFAHIMTASALTANATWPYYTLPLFESYAIDTLAHAQTEVFAVANLVTNKEQDEWIEYANSTYEDWVEEGHLIRHGSTDRLKKVGYHPYHSAPDFVNGGFKPDVTDREYYFPFWSFSPAPSTYGAINWNMVAVPDYAPLIEAMIELKNETLVTMVRPFVSAQGLAFTPEEHQARHDQIPGGESSAEHPHSFFWYPIHREINNFDSDIVGLVATGGSWDVSLRNLLPDGVEGIDAIIWNDCNQSYTYRIKGPNAFFMGEGRLNDGDYEKYQKTVPLNLHTHPKFTTTPGHCQYFMDIYPTNTFKESHQSNTPIIYASVIIVTFVLVTIVFFVYDLFVRRRNDMIIRNAAEKGSVLASLFPRHIRDQLLQQHRVPASSTSPLMGTKSKMTRFLDGEDDDDDMLVGAEAKPLADLFLETTVLFADITGFTAWASVREPSQVFTLLETVYSKFDYLAKRRRVFKIETVGDCYDAATGLPEPRKDHALQMARFARDCMIAFGPLVRNLEVSLGPDTGDLDLRIGINSGPVTAGVLRGERARFQLFGDTMNVTARMESTSSPGRIQLSHETAKLLVEAGKGTWLQMREQNVDVKGKGDMRTFWLHSTRGDGSSHNEDITDKFNAQEEEKLYQTESDNDRSIRLINWNSETLSKLLKQIVAHRDVLSDADRTSIVGDRLTANGNFLEEVKEIIELPEFDQNLAQKQRDPESVELGDAVAAQIKDYVSCIAHMYRENPFHNFEHASHVVMSVVKLLSRIVAPSELEKDFGNSAEDAASLHDHTYGITSDPLTQFACAFSALIHDVDHQGVPNAQLVKEDTPIAVHYNGRSVAEQNSLEIAWDLLMEDRFEAMRSCIYTTPSELSRFRQLVVNSVMATDIVDKGLKGLRDQRWERAFKTHQEYALGEKEDTERDVVNRKATIVIEHLIQASDISHTMQHWHVYRKWNERLFLELYRAYQNGRGDKNPAEFWAKGEIGFFDFYIIPLACKLKDCGVFGVSSGEFLDYARKNRAEWLLRGEEVVAEMVEKFSLKTDEVDDIAEETEEFVEEEEERS